MTGQRGFTLMEMLIGLALLGLLSLALFGALRLGTQTWERGEQRAQEVVDLRIVEGVLRRELARAYPLRVGEPNENKIAFDGDAHSVRFVGELPAYYTSGGLSRVELALRDSDPTQGARSKELVMRSALAMSAATEFPETEMAKDTVLLRGWRDVAFDYFGQESELADAEWHAAWKQSTRLPALLRVKLTAASEERSRELIIPLRLGEEAGCYQASYQRQCGPIR